MSESFLNQPLHTLEGIGERRAQLLTRELRLDTLEDLLYYFPYRYIDRRRIYPIAQVPDEPTTYVQLRARVESKTMAGQGKKRRLIVQISDASGSGELVWFSGIAWIEKLLEVGREYVFFGRPGFFNHRLSMVHPEVESLATLLMRPEYSVQGIYHTTEKLATNRLASRNIWLLIQKLWQLLEKQPIAETLPAAIIQQYRLMGLREALYQIHFPQSEAHLKAARYRLKFEELLGVELDIMSRYTERTTRSEGFLFSKVGGNFNTFYSNHLPFELTGAQKRVIKEIRADTITGHQMNRLLQGDVGSGKTLVALMSMLLALDNGYQSCMMAPTEILARQHFHTLERLLGDMEVNVAVLTGSTRKRERDLILGKLAEGEVDIIVGTHALLEERVQFENLGMVVIDEQHRFGVAQRARLWTKNQFPPHVLVMTATPIPRTLAMTLYGDLDMSIIDQLPPGRKPIKTYHYFEERRLEVLAFMRRQIAAGRQVYVVYPLIEGSEKMDYANLNEGFEVMLREFPQPEYRSVPLHGKMRAADKQEAMRIFKEGIAQIMVATSVIEVGVDVPNASVMVIEGAERFGLSQLHQLRGRVGRGSAESYCVLMTSHKLSREGRARMRAMVESTDGFYLAEMDMKLRGMGDLTGTQQSGLALNLHIADLSRDGEIIARARDAAKAILAADPELKGEGAELLRRLMQKRLGIEGIDFRLIS